MDRRPGGAPNGQRQMNPVRSRPSHSLSNRDTPDGTSPEGVANCHFMSEPLTVVPCFAPSAAVLIHWDPGPASASFVLRVQHSAGLHGKAPAADTVIQGPPQDVQFPDFRIHPAFQGQLIRLQSAGVGALSSGIPSRLVPISASSARRSGPSSQGVGDDNRGPGALGHREERDDASRRHRHHRANRYGARFVTRAVHMMAPAVYRD